MSREPRERILLGAGGAAAAVILFWALIWYPVASGAARLRASVEHKSALLVDLSRAAAGAPAPKAGAPRASTDSMVVLVDRPSRSHDLAGVFTRTRPDGGDGINVTFQEAPFDALLGWLMALQATYGIKVESASFNSTHAPGVVSGQVLLRRP
jgi:general secretion pathway protein M